MADSGRIDNPIDVAFEAWPDKPGDVGEKAKEVALAVGGAIFPPLEVFRILKEQLSIEERFARVEYFFETIRRQFRIIELDCQKDRERLTAVQETVASPRFQEAVAVACEEAVRATKPTKIDQFAFILTESLRPNRWADPGEDIGVMIRDIAQLGDKDLKVLSILRKVHSSAIETAPNLYEPDPFSRETGTLNTAIGVNGFHRDDFLSICERLRGFGLAARKASLWTRKTRGVNARGTRKQKCNSPRRKQTNYLQCMECSRANLAALGGFVCEHMIEIAD